MSVGQIDTTLHGMTLVSRQGGFAVYDPANPYNTPHSHEAGLYMGDVDRIGGGYLVHVRSQFRSRQPYSEAWFTTVGAAVEYLANMSFARTCLIVADLFETASDGLPAIVEALRAEKVNADVSDAASGMMWRIREKMQRIDRMLEAIPGHMEAHG